MTSKSRRLFIVANRLPVSIHNEENGPVILPTSGGLVSAISSYLEHSSEQFSEVFWAGVPGCSPKVWKEASTRLAQNSFTYLPVMLYQEQYNKYYNGFSNSVLWPLFHYFPSYAEYQQDEFDQYLQVNEHFAEILARQCRESDTVWIHDYHLMPLAQMLRDRVPNLTIGFFLHIPFPSYEIIRLMPRKWQYNLLHGMMGADLVGFHTIDYAAHFLECIQKILSIDNERNLVRYHDRLVKVDVFPISIDYVQFHQAYSKDAVVNLRQQTRQSLKAAKVIFSVDRLDYTKGVHNRLKAYELFLQQNPEYMGEVVFILNIVPSRDSIAKYAERKQMIEVMVSGINSRMGTLHWQPILYRYNSLHFDEMVALYSLCDLALITPMRDGMNLVAKEFVASRQDQRGVLVLSDMAGAAREMTSALMINPNDLGEMVEKIKEGLEMKPEEQAERMSIMQQRIANYDVKAWAEDFMTGLANIKEKQQTFQEIFLDDFAKKEILEKYRQSTRRLLLLDYDGTLVSYSPDPEDAVPQQSLLDLLGELGSREDTEIYLISGRSSSWLEKHFSGVPVHLIAEHGAKCKKKSENWQQEIPTYNEWKGRVHSIMEMYVRRCPHSFIEEKEFSMVWHFRNSNAIQGKLRAHELVSELTDYINLRNLQVTSGNKIVEVRSRGVDKGSAINKLLSGEEYDFIFAVGDDKTDEDMFKTLVGKKGCFTIKVGPNASYAQYNLQTPHMVVNLLEGLNHLPAAGKDVVFKM